MKLLNYISILFLSCFLYGQEFFYSESNIFSIDTQNPQVELSYPNGGEELIPGDSISVQWAAMDDNFGELPISLFISTEAGGSFDILTAFLPNLGIAPLNMPDINSAYCLLKIEAVDFFGNTAYDKSDSFFTIGSTDEGEIIDTLLTAYSESSIFIIDTQDPQVDIIYPNGGEELDAGETITYQWSAEDGNLGDTPISLALSTAAGGTFETFAQGLVNDGLEESVLPDINSTYCLLQIAAIDLFGNAAFDESDDFFSIGSDDEGEIIDTLLFAFSESDNFPIDTRDPEITILYPNGGEQRIDYENAEIAWLAEDDNLADGSIAAFIAFELGGWYVIVDTALANTGYAVVDLSVEGAVPERLWGMLKMTATDTFGNSGLDYSDDYFILGNPEGSLDANLVDSERTTVVLDWGWARDHFILLDGASLTFLEAGDQLAVIDEEGILNSSCAGGFGEIILASHTFSGDDSSYIALKAEAGEDWCAQGGERYPGYVSGNPIVFQFTDISADEVFSTEPTDMGLNGSATFSDEFSIIREFELTVYDTVYQPGAGSNALYSGFPGKRQQVNITYSAETRDDRAYNSFNIYRSRQRSRDECEDECAVDGYSGEIQDDICFCLIAEDEEQTYYFDLPNDDNPTMRDETFCYRVWLMNDTVEPAEKLVKSVDTCIGVDSFELYLGDSNLDGVVNVLDIVVTVNYILGFSEFSEDAQANADFNQDGSINVLDIVMAVQHILDN